MTSKSRLYTIIAVGVFAVLSVAIALTAITVTRSNFSTRSSDSRDDKTCLPVTAETLRDALGAGEQGNLCNNQKNLLLDVKYQGKELKCGQSSTKKDTEKAPTVKLANADKNARYTLLMVDPDASSHSLDKLKFWLHWAETDVSGRALQEDKMDGLTLMEYAGPTPQKGTGVHRYKIIVFESTKQGKAKLYLDKEDDRSQFSLDNFVEKNGLCSIVGLFQFTVSADK